MKNHGIIAFVTLSGLLLFLGISCKDHVIKPSNCQFYTENNVPFLQFTIDEVNFTQTNSDKLLVVDNCKDPIFLQGNMDNCQEFIRYKNGAGEAHHIDFRITFPTMLNEGRYIISNETVNGVLESKDTVYAYVSFNRNTEYGLFSTGAYSLTNIKNGELSVKRDENDSTIYEYRFNLELSKSIKLKDGLLRTRRTCK